MRIICAFLLTLLVGLQAHAAEVNIGPLCLSGVSEVADPTDLSFSDGSQWMRVRHRYSAPPSGSRANIVIFASPVQQDNADAPPDCAAMRKTAAVKGIAVILDGVIEELNLVSRIGIGQPGNRLWVDPDGKLDITLRKVNSGLQPLGGGELDLKGSWLWIRGIGQLISTPSRISGILELEAYDRRITNAKIIFPGGAEAVATLRQTKPRDENLTFRLDAATGVASLWQGTVSASSVRMNGGSLKLPLISLVDPALVGSSFVLSAKAGVLSGRLGQLRGGAKRLESEEANTALKAENLLIGDGSLTGDIIQSTSEFTWQTIAARNLSIKLASAALLTQRQAVIDGPASVKIISLNPKEVQASVIWTAPRLSGFPLTVPDGKTKSLELVLTGEPTNLKVSGKLLADQFGFSGFNIERSATFKFGATSAVNKFFIPIDIALRGVAGSLTLSDYNQKVMITAGIDGFKLKATLEVDPNNILDGSSVRIEPKGLLIGLSAATSLQPWLAGTKPGLAQSSVTVSNKAEVVIGSEASGQMEIESSLLTIAQPVLSVGEKGQEKRAAFTLNAKNSSTFSYTVTDRKLILEKALFSLSDVDFEFIDAGGNLDIGGTVVESPRLQMKTLMIKLDREKAEGMMKATDVKIAGSHYTRTRNAKTDTAFSGKQSKAFTIGALEAFPEFNNTSITVRRIDATSLAFALSDAKLSVGESLSLKNASISVRADGIKSDDEIELAADGLEKKDDKGNTVRKRHEYFSNFIVEADGHLEESEFSNAMQLDAPPDVNGLSLRGSGRSDLLMGEGRFALSAFSGRFQDAVRFQFACKDGRNPSAPSETRFTTGGTAGPIDVQIQNGKFLVEGALLGLNLIYKSDTIVECDSRSEKHVISPLQEWWTWGICPTWDDAFKKCKWSTKIQEISLSYHLRFGFYGLLGQATVAAPILSIKGGETKFCFLPPVVFVPMMIAMGITPQMEISNGTPGDVEKVINGLVHTTLASVESFFVTGLGNSAALAIGGTLTTPTGAVLACALLKKDIL